MKKIFYPLFIILVWLVSACNTTQNSTETILQGNVYYIGDNNVPLPVVDATVYAKESFAQAVTDDNGFYQLVFPELTETEMEISVVASKVGFIAQETGILALEGETVIIPDITLTKLKADTVISPVDTFSTSGDAAHIVLFGQPDDHIYIQSSGLQELSTISFLVTDSRGVPVDETHKVTVNFSILNGPDGGEFLFPESMDTDDGYVYTVLNSGTIAGPVQLQASFQVDGQTISTIPIRIAIYGGLPDADHFSVAFERVNIAGRVHFGILDQVTAFVGDKFSNPVAPGTVVYFATDYGIVGGSAVTDYMGRATVSYMSAQPLPPSPLTNPFAKITAYTYSDTLAAHTITSNGNLLLSGLTDGIQVNPGTFTYNDTNTPVQFSYTVQDIYGHPLVGDTRIQVEATDGTLYGDVSVFMNDTQSSGPGTTDFSFTWAPGDSLEAPQVFISITVDPPEQGNGYRSTSLSGSKTN